MREERQKNPIVIDKWLGLHTSLPSYLIPDFYVSDVLNMSFASIGYTNSFEFYSQFLDHTSTQAGEFLSSRTFKKSDGQQIPMLVLDKPSSAGSILYWYNSVAKKLEVLLDGLTAAKRMAFSGNGFNTDTQDGIFFCNGVENYSFWSGAIGTIASNTATVITLNALTGFTSAEEFGFPASGTVIVDDTEYSYSGRTGLTLTGLTALPTFTANSGVAQAADDSTHSAVTKWDILTVQDGRVVGARTDGIIVSLSKVGDGTDFTTSSDPDDSQSYNVIEGTGPITNVLPLKDYIVVFKIDLAEYYQIVFPTATTVARNRAIIRKGDDMGCAGPDAGLSILDRIYYTSPKGGIRWVGVSDQNDGFITGDLTNTIRPTLKDGIFTGSRMTYFEQERILISTFKKDSDSTHEDRQIGVEFVEDDALLQVRPITLMDNPFGDFFIYNNKQYAVSNLEAKIYEMFDGYTKDGGPALAFVTLKRYALGNMFVRKSLMYIGVRGRMASGGKLLFTLSYDRKGSLTVLEGSLEHNESDFITEGEVITIGDSEIGIDPTGGQLTDIDELDPFLIFFVVPTTEKAYDFALNILSEGINGDGIITGTRFTIEEVAFFANIEELNIDSVKKKPFVLSNVEDL